MKAHLDLSGIKKLKNKLQKLEQTEVEWGFLSGQHSKAEISYASLAWLLEEGNNKIPPRPAFKQTVAGLRTSHVAYEAEVKHFYKNFLEGTGSAYGIAQASGKHVTETHKDTMYNWVIDGVANQHNAPETISLKGFDMPFVETGELIQNVTYKIT